MFLWLKGEGRGELVCEDLGGPNSDAEKTALWSSWNKRRYKGPQFNVFYDLKSEMAQLSG